MSRIVIVSNRINLPSDRGKAGGSAVALREPARSYGGIWFGWSGQIGETVNDRPRLAAAGKVTYVSTDLTRDEFEQYYLGCSDSTLWPLLHHRVGLVDCNRRAFEAYLRVNARCAHLLRPLLRSGDLIWVNDFHLIAFAAALRRLGVANRIGYFFLHTPFPSFEVLAVLLDRDLLLPDLCTDDLVGFQTVDSLNAFFGSIAASSDARICRDGPLTACGWRSRAAQFPIGIDTEGFVKPGQAASGSPEALRLRESLAGRQLVFGVNRLDYSKGIPQCFTAVEWLLNEHPEHRRRFNYLPVAPHWHAELPQYRALRRELEVSTGRINGKFAEFDLSPTRYINKSLSRRTLAGFYRLPRVGLVTPLRCGVNLVAKEFVAAQDPALPSVLILSRFAGAACELESGLPINPIDAEAMAETLHQALVMPLAERQDRRLRMISVLRDNTITSWAEAFIAAQSPPAAAACTGGCRGGRSAFRDLQPGRRSVGASRRFLQMLRRRIAGRAPDDPSRRGYNLTEQTRFVATMMTGSAQTALLGPANEYEVRARRLEYGFVQTQKVLRGLQGNIRSSWEIERLRLLLADPSRGWSVAELTVKLRSSERAVLEALGPLRAAGLNDQDADGLNRYRPRTPELADLGRQFERACALPRSA